MPAVLREPNHFADQPYHCRIIAEAGVNHNGSMSLAIELIDIAAEAGVDAIKFQTFKSSSVVTKFASKAAYQKTNTNNDGSQLDMIRSLELSLDDHYTLLEHSNKRSIKFLSSPFDLDSAKFLVENLKLDEIKIASGEITNAPLLYEVARHGIPVILSTGMSTLGDIENALGVLAFGYLNTGLPPSAHSFSEAYNSVEGQKVLRDRVVLLHCTTEYPAAYDDVNLRAMDVLRNAFGLPVGFSDHTQGINIPIAACALRAIIIEKHFTINRELPGPDHKASLEPNELKEMVTAIRQVTKAVGRQLKYPTLSEIKNLNIARRSLVASSNIKMGEILTVHNISAKRPTGGLSPLYFWQVLGKKSNRDYEIDEFIDGEIVL